MDNTYISLLIKIPLVGIFVWFSLRLIAIFLESPDKRDVQWKAFLEEPPSWFTRWVQGGWETDAGVTVTPDSAMMVMAFLACVRIISDWNGRYKIV